jgi:putative transposase
MPQNPQTMYRWREWTPEQRRAILKERCERNQPCHSPAHVESDRTTYYMITAACFEHHSVVGFSDERMAEFSIKLCDMLQEASRALFAWVVLPNHYHVLVDAPEVKRTLKQLGMLHGRSSFDWNGEESLRGRQVWCNAAETAMKSEGHFYASQNYILNNPVHHGYCSKWTEWPFSSAEEYLSSLGRDQAIHFWNAYPLYEYGQSWDPPEL